MRRALPVILAWACTVSTVQGLTLQAVAVHANGLSFEGQLYTALSKGRTFACLRIIGTRLHIKGNREALAIHQLISQSTAARSALRQQPCICPLLITRVMRRDHAAKPLRALRAGAPRRRRCIPTRGNLRTACPQPPHHTAALLPRAGAVHMRLMSRIDKLKKQVFSFSCS